MHSGMRVSSQTSWTLGTLAPKETPKDPKGSLKKPQETL
jgi:hypothetical protein